MPALSTTLLLHLHLLSYRGIHTPTPPPPTHTIHPHTPATLKHPHHHHQPHLTHRKASAAHTARRARHRSHRIHARLDDPHAVAAVLAAAAALGQRLGSSSAVGRALSPPICAMLVTFAAASTRLLPPATPTLLLAQGAAVRLATPLLLFGADLRAVARRAAAMLPAFILACAGTLAGSALGIALLWEPLVATLGADGLKACAALCAKNIGGGLNFVAVAAAVGLQPAALTLALTVDNVLALVYFPLCSALGKDEADPGVLEPTTKEDARDEGRATAGMTEQVTRALGVATAAVYASQALAPSGYDLPLATVIMVALATCFSRQLAPLSGTANHLGMVLLYLFFASAGWSGGGLGLSTFLGGGRVLLAFLAVLYSVHGLVVLGGGGQLARLRPQRPRRLFVRPNLLVASNCCIGGPATASALAQGASWVSLVVPSVLIGNLGYALASFAGIALYRAFAIWL